MVVRSTLKVWWRLSAARPLSLWGRLHHYKRRIYHSGPRSFFLWAFSWLALSVPSIRPSMPRGFTLLLVLLISGSIEAQTTTVWVTPSISIPGPATLPGGYKKLYWMISYADGSTPTMTQIGGTITSSSYPGPFTKAAMSSSKEYVLRFGYTLADNAGVYGSLVTLKHQYSYPQGTTPTTMQDGEPPPPTTGSTTSGGTTSGETTSGGTTSGETTSGGTTSGSTTSGGTTAGGSTAGGTGGTPPNLYTGTITLQPGAALRIYTVSLVGADGAIISQHQTKVYPGAPVVENYSVDKPFNVNTTYQELGIDGLPSTFGTGPTGTGTGTTTTAPVPPLPGVTTYTRPTTPTTPTAGTVPTSTNNADVVDAIGRMHSDLWNQGNAQRTALAGIQDAVNSLNTSAGAGLSFTPTPTPTEAAAASWVAGVGTSIDSIHSRLNSIRSKLAVTVSGTGAWSYGFDFPMIGHVELNLQKYQTQFGILRAVALWALVAWFAVSAIATVRGGFA